MTAIWDRNPPENPEWGPGLQQQPGSARFHPRGANEIVVKNSPPDHSDSAKMLGMIPFCLSPKSDPRVHGLTPPPQQSPGSACSPQGSRTRCPPRPEQSPRVPDRPCQQSPPGTAAPTRASAPRTTGNGTREHLSRPLRTRGLRSLCPAQPPIPARHLSRSPPCRAPLPSPPRPRPAPPPEPGQPRGSAPRPPPGPALTGAALGAEAEPGGSGGGDCARARSGAAGAGGDGTGECPGEPRPGGR